MAYRVTLTNRSYTFHDLRELMAKASPSRSGDQLAGVAAGSAAERVAAQMLLAEVPLARFLEEMLVPSESDEVTRLIVDTHDAGAFEAVKGLTVGEFREWLLAYETDGAALARVAAGLTPEMVAAVSKVFKKALKDNGLVVPMATTNLFSDAVFKDGAFTSNNAKVRAYAIQKTMRAMDLGAEFGAKIYVFWGGREGVETDAAKNPIDSIKRFREAIDFLCEYSIQQKYGYKFAFEAKPNEPRGHIYFAVTGSYLALIPTLAYPDMCGVNPEVAHEHMAGLDFVHHVAQAIEMKKLFHIDLNDQEFGRYDQDFRFGQANLKHAFFLVKLLEDTGYNGPRHFDAHALRTSDYQDVKEFARGCMRTYMILKEKAARWNADREIQALRNEINVSSPEYEKFTRKFSAQNAKKLLAAPLDRVELAKARLPYERLDQLTMELIMGVR